MVIILKKNYKIYKDIIVKKLNYVFDNVKKLIEKGKVIFIKEFNIIKEYLLCAKNRRKNLTIFASLIVINLFILIGISTAFYENTAGFVILHGFVGDFQNANYDYVLKIYLENSNNLGVGNGTYHLASLVPNNGYSYSSYTCENNSVLTYDTTNGANVILDEPDICSIYFNISNTVDVKVNINLEKEVGSNTYNLVSNIPYYGYTYDSYTCVNNSTLNYDSNTHKIIITNTEKDYCDIYYKKEETDIISNLYIETGLDTNKYTKKSSIPSNTIYELNTTRSSCTNNEVISYENGYIIIPYESNSTCDIYLDVNNE